MDRDVHDSSELSTLELEARITELAARLHAENRRWLGLIAEFDRREGWSDGLMPSCAHWLNWKCGLDLGTAREKLRVAHALEDLPAIGAAMARGELSYSKARALTRVASPATEGVLLTAALQGTANDVELLVRQYRRGDEVAEVSREARQYANRRLSWAYDEDGSLIVRAHLPAEAGAMLLRALEGALADVPLPDVSAEESASHAASHGACRTAGHAASRAAGSVDGVSAAACATARSGRAARRADALVVIAESYLAHGAEALNGGDRHAVTLHVDAAALQSGDSGRCELEDGPVLPLETGRRLACDASVVTIAEDGLGEPLDVGRKTRSIPPALRRALDSRDRGCVFPGCTHKRYVDGHHIRHWADGGETKLANLVTLCRFHHRAVHEGRVHVERLDDGAWRFTRPDGRILTTVPRGHTRPFEGLTMAAGGPPECPAPGHAPQDGASAEL